MRPAPTSAWSRATRGCTTASTSTAATATRRSPTCSALPVVLVLDARGMTRGIAPLILGYQAFDRGHPHRRRDPQPPRRQPPRVQAARGDRALHRRRRCSGAVARRPSMAHRRAPSRPDARPTRQRRASTRIARDRRAASAAQVDLDRAAGDRRTRAGAARAAAARPQRRAPADACASASRSDEAFGFYYAGRPRRPGAPPAPSWCPSTPCATRACPTVDGLFIGGGFPEMLHGRSWRRTPRCARRSATRIEAGLPAYAECGGLMYLARTPHLEGQTRTHGRARSPADIVMHDKPVGRGYVRLQPTARPSAGRANRRRGRDPLPRVPLFRASRTCPPTPATPTAWRAATASTGERDGIVYKQPARFLQPPARPRRRTTGRRASSPSSADAWRAQRRGCGSPPPRRLRTELPNRRPACLIVTPAAAAQILRSGAASRQPVRPARRRQARRRRLDRLWHGFRRRARRRRGAGMRGHRRYSSHL
ncbi:MAG: hypothetical protein MZW92_79000 [Comamonadaceae bacterium]|nr:hypothetical protein [Comamonadaceae bacterium]